MRIKQGVTIFERLWRHIAPEPSSGCWLWLGALDSKGYGLFRMNMKLYKAHRATFAAYGGTIPPGLQLDHKCRVRSCVNPDHLEPVTALENTRRGLVPTLHSSRTYCRRGHALTTENARPRNDKNRKIGRVCRACKRINALTSKQAKETRP